MKPPKKVFRKTETELNRTRILDVLETVFAGSYCRKITASIYKRGMADNFCCIDGLFVAIEAKKQGEKPTVLQEVELTKVAIAGGVSLCVTFNYDGTKTATEYTIDRIPGAMVLSRRILEVLACTSVQSAGAR